MLSLNTELGFHAPHIVFKALETIAGEKALGC
jgi:hypothetical protein